MMTLANLLEHRAITDDVIKDTGSASCHAGTSPSRSPPAVPSTPATSSSRPGEIDKSSEERILIDPTSPPTIDHADQIDAGGADAPSDLALSDVPNFHETSELQDIATEDRITSPPDAMNISTDGSADHDDLGACLPECILSLKSLCPPSSGTCSIEMPHPEERDICYGNGTKVRVVTNSPTAKTVVAYRADGMLCYTETIQNDQQTFVSSDGEVVATVRTDPDGTSQVTCRDGQLSSYRADSVACRAYSAIGSQCTMGSCSF
jgi:hypothetical protein